MDIFAIGDIHGFTGAFDTLLEQLSPSQNRLVFLGDFIDRGPQTRDVLEGLITLSQNPNHVFLRGNHDETMLRARYEKRAFKSWIGEAVGGKETLRSYDANSFTPEALALIPETHWRFLEETHFCFETDTHIFAHASVTAAPLRYNEPDWLMRGSLGAMMPHPSGKRVIVGHSQQISGVPLDLIFAVCIDTFCYGRKWLSALNVVTDEVIQANEAGEIRRFRLTQPPTH